MSLSLLPALAAILLFAAVPAPAVVGLLPDPALTPAMSSTLASSALEEDRWR